MGESDMTDCDAPGITAEDGTADDVARRVHDRPFGQKIYIPNGPWRTFPGQPEITVGLRVPCRSFNLIPVADSEEAAVEAVDAVRGPLREEHG